MARFIPVFFLLSYSLAVLQAQSDSLLLDNKLKFKDGVYLNFASFCHNQPDYQWEELGGRMVFNPDDYSAQIEFLSLEEGRPLAMDSLWGVCFEGLPYVLVKPKNAENNAWFFAGLRVRGRISYFEYEMEEEQEVEITAYNPLTGRAFRKGQISKTQTVVNRYMLRMLDGKVDAFNKANLLEWVKDDEQMYETVSALSKEEATSRLYKCLLIYDDRNPIFIQQKP